MKKIILFIVFCIMLLSCRPSISVDDKDWKCVSGFSLLTCSRAYQDYLTSKSRQNGVNK